MALSQDLINQFAKLTNSNENRKNSEATVRGTYKTIDGEEFVQIDGSDIWTPVKSTVQAETGDQVTVLIKDHTATITGNITSPSASSKIVGSLKDNVDANGNKILQMDNTIIQQNNTIIQLDNEIKQQQNTITQFQNTIDQQNNTIEQYDNTIKQQNDTINSMNNTITSQSNQITEMNNTINSQGNVINEQGNLISQQGNLIVQQGNTISQQGTTLETFDSEMKVINSAFNIQDGKLTGLSEIVVEELETNTLNAKYANIDFANIGIAAIEKVFADSGIIKDLIVNDQKITGELVGVTIKGDLIEGNTIKADKLVVKGEDGLYYKLNVDSLGEATASSDEKYQNGLDGSVIVTNSIVAEKIAVDDLVAFDATIGGFNITDDAIYSGAKTTVNNTTRGIYLDNTGQIAFGDSNNYIKYFKDETDGIYKIDIRASEIHLGTGKSIEETISDEVREEFIVNGSDSIHSAVDSYMQELQTAGGRNLLLNSNGEKMSTSNMELSEMPYYELSDYGKNIISREKTGYPNMVTLSFDVKSSEYHQCEAYVKSTNENLDLIEDFYITPIDIDSGDIWRRVSITYEILYTENPNDYAGVIIHNNETIVNDGNNDWTGKVMYVKNAKLEIGEKASDWTPAPEDVDNTIGNVQDSANAQFQNAEIMINQTQDNIDELSEDTNNKFQETKELITQAQSSLDILSNMISTLVTDGNGTSLMTQTADGWTFDISSITNNLENLRVTIGSMETVNNDTKSAIDKLNNLVDAVSKKTAYINIGTDEDGDPCIELGESESQFKVRITNTAIDFLEGSSKIAYANNKAFNSDVSIVNKELHIGGDKDYVLKERPNGRLSLIYVG